MYGLREKKLIEHGHPLLDDMPASYKPSAKNERTTVIIAPSHQEDNILDLCIEPLLAALVGHGYRIIVRPHPHYGRMERFAADHGDLVDSGELIVELAASSSASVCSSDVLIT